jgi:hypothetical protein
MNRFALQINRTLRRDIREPKGLLHIEYSTSIMDKFLRDVSTGREKSLFVFPKRSTFKTNNEEGS